MCTKPLIVSIFPCSHDSLPFLRADPELKTPVSEDSSPHLPNSPTTERISLSNNPLWRLCNFIQRHWVGLTLTKARPTSAAMVFGDAGGNAETPSPQRGEDLGRLRVR